ncbi:GntR family transcriptional regulator [Paraburkholderia sp. CNPSo 3157]|uniref:GntR family transcriptional regulator n=1 Tax=Paraburkholderia franconis TaxID=2654983 RepID=A0A7X1NGV9_9BURK|nr:GntR family transcriptional regulator [Paraburkholderia franconis]MPW21316.1 GntR family transcriptional regulator [Paraburkholderia franconis]
MKFWIPELTSCKRPVYLAVVHEIEAAIDAGTLRPGDALLPQRLLADFLGLHVNTVNRALREAARRGLTAGYRRFGTVVRGPSG